MKVLLDENLAHRLRKNLAAHEVFTVSYKGWAGLKNGELLRAAENDGIEVFLTGDQTLTYEQNLTGRTIAIVALSSVEWNTFLSITCGRSSPRLTTPNPAVFRRSIAVHSLAKSNAAQFSKSVLCATQQGTSRGIDGGAFSSRDTG